MTDTRSPADTGRRRSRSLAAGVAVTLVVASALMSVSSTASAQPVRPRNGGFECRASALRVKAVHPAATVEPVTGNATEVPCRDGAHTILDQHPTAGDVAVDANVLTARTEVNPDDLDANFPTIRDKAGSSAKVTALDIRVGTTVISVKLLHAEAAVTCDGFAAFGLAPKIASSSFVDSLNINGVPTIVGSTPTDIPIPLVGVLHLNHTSATASSVVQRALWLESDLADVVVSEAKASYTGNPCAMKPKVIT